MEFALDLREENAGLLWYQLVVEPRALSFSMVPLMRIGGCVGFEGPLVVLVMSFCRLHVEKFVSNCVLVVP